MTQPRSAGATHPPQPRASQAWLLQGLTGSTQGTLAWGEGRLRFATGDGQVFSIAPADLTYLVFPWYYFGGGVKLGTANARYRLSFARPNGAEYPLMRGAAEVGSPIALLGAAEKLTDMRSGYKAGAQWRDILLAIRGGVHQ